MICCVWVGLATYCVQTISSDLAVSLAQGYRAADGLLSMRSYNTPRCNARHERKKMFWTVAVLLYYLLAVLTYFCIYCFAGLLVCCISGL